VPLAAGGSISVLAALAVLVLLARNAGLALAALRLPAAIGSNDWGALNASGPWYQLGQVLWLMNPFTTAMAVLGAAAIALGPPRARLFGTLPPGACAPASLVLLLTLGFVAASAFGPNLEYLRIMAPANPSYCLLAAIGVRYLLLESESWLRGKAYPALLALLPLVFVLTSLRDYSLYVDVVVRSGMQDLAVRWLLDGIERRNEARPAPEAERNGAVAVVALTASSRGAPESAARQLERSLQYCQKQEFAECVSAAQSAVRIDPQMADAWNNAAIGYAGLRLWDDAARCASEALRLRPDFQLARNNLAWVMAEKAKLAPALQP
jgi:tetratricopeptide (TPR) repeat protein